MRNKILLSIVIILSLILILVVCYSKKTNYYFPMPSAVKQEESPITIRLLNEATNEITTVNLEDYIIGVVAAEMPSSFEIEALKAQAVAARTYAMYKKTHRNLDYDCIIGTKDQAYKNNEQLLKQWNFLFFKNYLKIRDAVLATRNEILTYNNEVINAFYFSMSNGQTENSELVFKENLPYLNSVESKWDNETLKNYEVTKTIPRYEFCDKLKITCDAITIENENRSPSNRVLNIEINQKSYTGTQIRQLLTLRSTDFSINYDDENIYITTKGFGHGVGMSQYGANGMAKEGKKYQEILNHYYQNTQISQIS